MLKFTKSNSHFLKQIKRLFCNTVTFNIDGRNLDLSPIWLRDMCRCEECYERKQKSLKKIENNFIKFDSTIDTIKQIDISNWQVLWKDGHKSDYSEKYLSKFLLKTNQNTLKTYWNIESLNQTSVVTRFSYNDVCNCQDVLENVINSLNKVGFCFIDQSPKDKKSLANILNLFGGLMDTLFSDNYDSTMELTDNDLENDLGWTNNRVPGHTDFTYFYYPSAIVGLHLLKQNGTGGALSIVDGFHVAEKFRLNEPEIYQSMLDIPIRWTYYTGKDEKTEVNLMDTILKLDSITGLYKQIKWNPAYLYPIYIDDKKRMKEIYQCLQRIYEEFNKNSENALIIQPEIGTIILFDNWRMIHARSTGFVGDRIMHCGDISKDAINVKFKNSI